MATKKLPGVLWSALGPVTVTMKDLKGENALGQFKWNSREIELEKTLPPSTQAVTLFHEITHMGLMDSGVANSLTHEQNEAVCDALGALLGGMLLNGCLSLKPPKE